MYKLLLCWRYLRTRYIALASIISVTLGVATLIVVNAVMAGFSHEMEDRMHAILSDIVVEGMGLDSIDKPEWHMDEIRQVAGQWIEGMTATVHVPALLTAQSNGRQWQQQIMFIGIDEKTHTSVSDFSKYLQHPQNRRQLSFELHDGGYDVRDHHLGEKAQLRIGMERAGWPHRRLMAERLKAWEATRTRHESPTVTDPDRSSKGGVDDTTAPVQASDAVENPFGPVQAKEFDRAKEQHPGIVMGIALASVRDHQGADHFRLLPGDDVTISVPTAGDKPSAQSWQFTIVDFYESKMSEYDSTFVFVPMQVLQSMRVIGTNVSSIQIKLKPGADGEMVRNVLRSRFIPQLYGVYTWRDKQGPLLAAVQMEKAVLNILLFLIIAVAGFGILAIFFMIVVEKTRDVGILKSLGASSSGIMGIFLGYGLSLGMVGAGAGLVMGLLFVQYINQIRSALEWATGQAVFDPAIYYFYEIPTIVDVFTLTWIVFGALSIAVLASVLPALRAARLHPVEALRYE